MEHLIELLSSLGTASLPFLIFSIIYLGRSFIKFDKSISLLAKSVEDLATRIERLENWAYEDKKS